MIHNSESNDRVRLSSAMFDMKDELRNRLVQATPNPFRSRAQSLFHHILVVLAAVRSATGSCAEAASAGHVRTLAVGPAAPALERWPPLNPLPLLGWRATEEDQTPDQALDRRLPQDLLLIHSRGPLMGGTVQLLEAALSAGFVFVLLARR